MKKLLTKPLWINFIISIILMIGALIWAIIMTSIDYEMKTIPSILAAIFLIISIIYFFVSMMILLVLWARKRANAFENYTSTLISELKPEQKEPKNKKKIAILVITPFLMLAFMILFIFGINSDNFIISGLTAIGFIIGLIALLVIPRIFNYRSEKKFYEDNQETKITINDYYMERELETKSMIFVRTSALGRQFFMVPGYNCYYLVKVKLGLDPNTIVADDRLLENKHNKKILISEIDSFYIDKALTANKLKAMIKPIVVIKTAKKKYSLIVFSDISDEAIKYFFTPIKHKDITKEFFDKQEKKDEINILSEEISSKAFARCRLISLIATVFSMTFSVALFFLYFGAIFIFPILTFFIIFGIILGLFFNKYFSILEISRNYKNMPERFNKKRHKSSVLGIIFPPIMALALRAMLRFNFIEMDKFLLYTLFAFLILAGTFLPLIIRSKQLRLSYFMLLFLFVLYSPSVIAYTNVAFYQSADKVIVNVEEKIYYQSSDYNPYRIKITYKEKEREMAISKNYYNRLEINDEITLVDIKGLYNIHYLLIEEQL